MPFNANQTDLARTRIIAAALCFVAIVLSGVASSALSLRFQPSAELAAALHLLLEFIATTIAVVVVAVSFQSLDRDSGHSATTLIYAFAVVACAGIAHTVVFQGTPVSGEQQAAIDSIYFWLVRRLFETGAFCLIAGSVALRRSRLFWVGAALLTTALVIWFSVSWSASLGSLQVPGVGPSRIAYGIDATFAAVNLVTALLLWRRGIRSHSRSDSLLAGSCAILGLASLMLVIAPGSVQLPLFMGHVLRAIAYGCLYAAVYLFAIREPHELLRESENRLRDSREQLKALGDNLKELNAELEQRVAERTAGLTQANRSLETFSHLVAHDLRAPLRHVEGFSSILKSEYAGRLDAEGRRLLDKVIEGGETMNRLIEGMLSVARLESATLARGDTDLSALCASICRALAEADPGRQVEFRIQPGLVDSADRTLIRNVLENLLGNAWKFTSREADALIEFGAVEHDGERVYFVRDNGAGFDPKQADRLFTLFHRLHLAQEFPGTGVGLASVRSIVANHGGRVWAEGAVGKGATLFFTLGTPLSQPQPGPTAAADSLAVR